MLDSPSLRDNLAGKINSLTGGDFWGGRLIRILDARAYVCVTEGGWSE